MASQAAWNWIIRGLCALGTGCLLWCVGVTLLAVSYQRQAEVLLAEAAASPAFASGTAAAAAIPDPARGDIIGQLQIPRLKLSTVVVQGDDDATLRKGVGHLPDTTLPWNVGNTALAGHRDTFFKALRAVSVGDSIAFRTTRGVYAYRVRDMRIVNPSSLSVLRPTDHSTLTLITCYPFSYIGRAPQRFVVQADQISDEHDEGAAVGIPTAVKPAQTPSRR